MGAQLLYPDGRLQEAGGGCSPTAAAGITGVSARRTIAAMRCPQLRLRQRAAIVIPRALFIELGGFDTRYAPAYYEDTDPAFAVRAARQERPVPAGGARRDSEGATAGTDTGSGIKAYQVRNRERFAEKWQAALQHQPVRARATPALLHARTQQI